MSGLAVVRGVLAAYAIFFVCLLSRPTLATECFGNTKVDLKEPALCSRIVEFGGACGHANYNIPGWGSDVAIAVGAWEKAPIRIVAVSADAVVRARWHTVTGSIFAGNSFNNDPLTPQRYAMAGLSDLRGNVSAVLHSEQHFPSGFGMQLPAEGQPWQQIHLDVHITCEPAGARYAGNLSVWYVLDK